MLNLAQLAVMDNDATSARQALDAVEKAMQVQPPLRRQVVGFISLKGDVEKLEGDLPAAEAAYRDAMTLDPSIPTPHLSLAVVLAMQGKPEEARAAAEAGIALLAPDDQSRRRQQLASILEKPDSRHD
jgi:Flp pilus assembly protein TadD